SIYFFIKMSIIGSGKLRMSKPKVQRRGKILVEIPAESTDPDYDKIMAMFHGRCVHCGKKSVTIHEILPRSKGKIAMQIENRVPVCAEIHNRIHTQTGVRAMVNQLRQWRERALATYGD